MAKAKKYSTLRPQLTKRGKPNNRTGVKAIETIEREAIAFELRKQGLSYNEIGKRLNTTSTTAWNYVNSVLTSINEKLNEDVTRVRILEVSRLDDMLAKLYPKIMAGQEGAITTALRIAERRSKMLGLDAPEKINHAGADGGPIEVSVIQGLSDEELDARILRIQQYLCLPAPSITAIAAEATVSGSDGRSSDARDAITADGGAPEAHGTARGERAAGE